MKNRFRAINTRFICNIKPIVPSVIMKSTIKITAGILDYGFFKQITRKYNHTFVQHRLALYFLVSQIARKSKHLTKNMHIDLSLLYRFYMYLLPSNNNIFSNFIKLEKNKKGNENFYLKKASYLVNAFHRHELSLQQVLYPEGFQEKTDKIINRKAKFNNKDFPPVNFFSYKPGSKNWIRPFCKLLNPNPALGLQTKELKQFDITNNKTDNILNKCNTSVETTSSLFFINKGYSFHPDNFEKNKTAQDVRVFSQKHLLFDTIANHELFLTRLSNFPEICKISKHALTKVHQLFKNRIMNDLTLCFHLNLTDAKQSSLSGKVISHMKIPQFIPIIDQLEVGKKRTFFFETTSLMLKEKNFKSNNILESKIKDENVVVKPVAIASNNITKSFSKRKLINNLQKSFFSNNLKNMDLFTQKLLFRTINDDSINTTLKRKNMKNIQRENIGHRENIFKHGYGRPHVSQRMLPDDSHSLYEYRTNTHEFVYHSKNKFQINPDNVQKTENKKISTHQGVDNLVKDEIGRSFTAPEVNLMALSDKVYDIIAERIKRELTSKGR